MAHLRARHALPLFMKRLKFSRVVAIQGCRQSGKSVLARDLIVRTLSGAEYLSFDRKAVADFARSNPETFLDQHNEARPLAIDETQKVPDIFDAIKFRVDEDPRPGQYLLLGSTEFSKELRIRESLTGRMTRIRLYSLNLGECLELGPASGALGTLIQPKIRITRPQLLKHLQRGGFPGAFAVRNSAAHREFVQDWLDLTIRRDLHQFPKTKIDADLAIDVLSALATTEEPSAAGVAHTLRRDTRRVQKILDLLETLFVVHRLPPHTMSTGKALYFYCDPALATHFHADFERQLLTWVLHEQLSQRSYREDRQTQLTFFRNSKGRFVHLLLHDPAMPKKIRAIKILSSERFDSRDFEILRALRNRGEKQGLEVETLALGPVALNLKEDKILVHPWECLG